MVYKEAYRIKGDKMSKELYEITGTFRVSIEAEDEEEALKLFDNCSVADLSRVDINDIFKW